MNHYAHFMSRSEQSRNARFAAPRATRPETKETNAGTFEIKPAKTRRNTPMHAKRENRV
ncbi:hypothetical protein KIH75_04680 [Bifidobacterium sp. 64T4]|uniref:hypothetical protein n=1 Tax=Bifidobacterium pongonis TaxID=2834432 RepID=UPI001C55AB3F|nr:hypothetical protein [Bifidobacterium pongonis]MBW3094644.1 hypothetical protein [Bifidobacterium pongonis]